MTILFLFTPPPSPPMIDSPTPYTLPSNRGRRKLLFAKSAVRAIRLAGDPDLNAKVAARRRANYARGGLGKLFLRGPSTKRRAAITMTPESSAVPWSDFSERRIHPIRLRCPIRPIRPIRPTPNANAPAYLWQLAIGECCQPQTTIPSVNFPEGPIAANHSSPVLRR
jgi:hypothetical protein